MPNPVSFPYFKTSPEIIQLAGMLSSVGSRFGCVRRKDLNKLQTLENLGVAYLASCN